MLEMITRITLLFLLFIQICFIIYLLISSIKRDKEDKIFWKKIHDELEQSLQKQLNELEELDKPVEEEKSEPKE